MTSQTNEWSLSKAKAACHEHLVGDAGRLSLCRAGGHGLARHLALGLAGLAGARALGSTSL